MKFVKENFKLIIGFIIGVILTSSIVVYANISATSVDYTNEKNVKQALDDLYSKIPSGKKTITYNGNNIDVMNYATVDVNVPAEDKGVTRNSGTFSTVVGTNNINIGFSPSIVKITRISNGNTWIYVKSINTNKFWRTSTSDWGNISSSNTSGITSVGTTVGTVFSTAGVEFKWFAIK